MVLWDVRVRARVAGKGPVRSVLPWSHVWILWEEDDFMAARIEISIASLQKNGHAQSFRNENNTGIRLIRIRQVTFEMLFPTVKE